jgi:hypothetical protein
MKRLLGLLLLTAAATLWLFSASPGAADDDDGPTHTVTAYSPKALVCYDVDKGDDVKVDVTPNTKSYGKDDAQVRRLVMMCETSTIGTFPVPTGPFLYIVPSPPPVADTAIYACYALRGGDDPKVSANLKTPSFGTDKVVIGTSNMMCEAGKKHVVNPDGSISSYGVSTNTIFQCFKLGEGDNPNLAVKFANNNFGADVVKTGNTIQMCEEGEKYRDIHGQTEVTGFANGVVHVCYDIAGWADDEMKTVVLETENFGRDEVVVRQSTQICQVGSKTEFLTVTPARP